MLAAILAAILALIAWGYFAPRQAAPDPTAIFLASCEAALADSLVSPSSYRRLDVTGPHLTPLTLDWYRARNAHLSAYEQGTERERNLAADLVAMTERQIAQGHQVATAVIRYEAMNRLGVSLAGRALCETVTPSSGLPANPATPTEIWVNLQARFARPPG
jgi:hypothetical protein